MDGKECGEVPIAGGLSQGELRADVPRRGSADRDALDAPVQGVPEADLLLRAGVGAEVILNFVLRGWRSSDRDVVEAVRR